MMTVVGRGGKTTGTRIMSQIAPISGSVLASSAAGATGATGAGTARAGAVDVSAVSISALRAREEQSRRTSLHESRKAYSSSHSQAQSQSQSAAVTKAKRPSHTQTKTYTPTYRYTQTVRRASQSQSQGGKSVSLSAEELAQQAVFLFTDGSCLGNQNVQKQSCPAGWGVLAVRIETHALPEIAERLCAASGGRAEVDLPAQHVLMNSLLTEARCEIVASLRGPVIIDETGSLAGYSLGATLGSNNTAELSAIGEALLHFRDHLSTSLSPPPRHCVVLHDSEYAAKSILGEFNGTKNLQLIHRVRAIFQEVQRRLQERYGDQSSVLFVKVKAHSGYTFNEMADALAKRGAENDLPLAIGRYASVSSEESSS